MNKLILKIYHQSTTLLYTPFPTDANPEFKFREEFHYALRCKIQFKNRFTDLSRDQSRRHTYLFCQKQIGYHFILNLSPDRKGWLSESKIIKESEKHINWKKFSKLTGGFLGFFSLYCIQNCFICRPSDSTVSEDAGTEPRTVATSALAVRRSNH